MSLINTNGQSADSLVDPSGAPRPTQAALHEAEAAAVRVMDLPTSVIRTPEGNDIDLEAVEELRANMAEHGQLVEIIVFPHPAMAGRYVCADGNHRLAAKRLLGESIRCRMLDKALDEAELITIRVTTATIRKAVDKAAVGADIFRWMQITGADQVQATANFGYSSQSTVSKLLRPYMSGIDELLMALKERRIAPASAYLVAGLPADVQRAGGEVGQPENARCHPP